MPDGTTRQIPIWQVFPMITEAVDNRPMGEATRAVIDSVSDNGVDVGMGHLCQVVRIIHGAKISTDAVINRKRQSNGIYAQGFFGAEVEPWWHREGSNAGTEAGRRRIS